MLRHATGLTISGTVSRYERLHKECGKALSAPDMAAVLGRREGLWNIQRATEGV
jgi:hypothetical protein